MRESLFTNFIVFVQRWLSLKKPLKKQLAGEIDLKLDITSWLSACDVILCADGGRGERER